MSPEPRDELDRTLAAGLAGLAPAADDPDAVLASMQPRLRRARTRNRIARASLLAVAIVGVASLAAVALGRDNNNRITVEGPNTTPSVSAGSTTQPTTSTTLRRQPTPSTTFTTPPQGTGGPDSTVPGGGPLPGDPGATTPTTSAQNEPRTFSSAGGTVTVRFAGGRLTLVSYQAATGYSAEVHRNEPDDVEVRFEGPDDARIRVRVENGRLIPDID